MKTIKGLTDNQTQLINNLIDELKNNNISIVDIDTDVIDSLLVEANSLVEAQKRFYREIEENNTIVLQKRNEIKKLFYSKLIKLFKNHSDVNIVEDNQSIKIGFKNGERWLNGYIYILFNEYLSTEQNGTISFYFDNNDKNPCVKKYSGVYVAIDKEVLNLSDFENNAVFQNKVFEMFRERGLKK